MAKMKWTKPSAETVAYFERIAPGPPIQARRMFGMPARFLNGHMLVGVFGNTFMLHLSEDDREECIAAGAKPFAPMGREAKEYVDVPPGLFDDRTLKEWIVRGMRYLGRLPPKLEGKRAAKNGKAKRASAPPRSRTASAPSAPRKPTRAPKAKPASKKAAARRTSAAGRNGARAAAPSRNKTTASARTKATRPRKTSRRSG